MEKARLQFWISKSKKNELDEIINKKFSNRTEWFEKIVENQINKEIETIDKKENKEIERLNQIIDMQLENKKNNLEEIERLNQIINMELENKKNNLEEIERLNQIIKEKDNNIFELEKKYIKETKARDLRELRKERDVTQLELAKMVNVTRSTIANWETGKRGVELKNIKKLSKFYNLPIGIVIKLAEKSKKGTKCQKK